MTQKTKFLLATALFGFSYAIPLQEREVPQEHSHERMLVSVRKLLAISNPLEIKDPVFGLLGDKAASEGAGKVKKLACLQRKTADTAFTNAKAANDVEGMTNTLIYASLERNTGAVGRASETCDEAATNAEVNALKQHQDPASPGADVANKELVLELARQISSIGGKPEDAALSATFAPGKIGDPTAKGNSCDDNDDPEGCIFTKKLIQVEATPEEIKDAVKSGGSSSSSSVSNSSTDSESNTKEVRKRHQVTNNPHTVAKIALRPKEVPKIIPRHINISKRDLSNSAENSVEKRSRENKDIASPLQSRRVVMTPGLNKRLNTIEIEDISSYPKKKRDIDGPDFDFDNNNNDNDKVKRDNDGPDFDNDNNNNNNDNEKVKRDDNDKNRRGRKGNRRNRNRNRKNGKNRNNDKRKRSVINSIKISEKKNSAADASRTNRISSRELASENGSIAKRANDGGKNVQSFTGSKGGSPPEVIETPNSDRPFTVNGNTFVGEKVALQRSCDIQHNSCANAANSGAGGSVAECEDQQKKCFEAASITTKRSVEKRSIFSFLTKREINDFGSCSDPTVEFNVGFDGRKEASFKAVNQKDFNHGSTQKLKITSDFICQRLESSCKAPQNVIDSCKSASEAASSLSGQAAADAFNKAFA